MRIDDRIDLPMVAVYIDELERLLGHIVGGDYGVLCDHPEDCACTAAQAIRLLRRGEADRVIKVDVHALDGYVSTAYLDDERPDGARPGEWKHTGTSLVARWDDDTDRWVEVPS